MSLLSASLFLRTSPGARDRARAPQAQTFRPHLRASRFVGKIRFGVATIDQARHPRHSVPPQILGKQAAWKRPALSRFPRLIQVARAFAEERELLAHSRFEAGAGRRDDRLLDTSSLERSQNWKSRTGRAPQLVLEKRFSLPTQMQSPMQLWLGISRPQFTLTACDTAR